MQRWEYLVERISSDFKLFNNALNMRGEQGWELVSVGNNTCVFKRPK